MDLTVCCGYNEYQSICRKFGKHSRRNFWCASEFNKNHCQGCALRKFMGAQCAKLWNPGYPAYDFYKKNKYSKSPKQKKVHRPPYKEQGVSLNLCLIGLNQLYTGHTGRSSSGQRLIIKYRCCLRSVFTWHSGNELAYRFQAISVFLLLFSSFLLHLVFFLVIFVVLSCFFL